VTFVFEPSRLSLARRRRGWSRPEIARRVEIKPRTINAYEMGERVPSEESLKVLARVLDFPVGFFGMGKVERIQEDGVSFRALSKMTATHRTQALASGELALDLSAFVDSKFNLPRVDVPDLHPQPSPETAAQSLRIKWGLGDKPITNTVTLLESKGVRVFSLAEHNKSLDAFSFWKDGKPFIFLNTLKSAERSRFDAAHELGHLVIHRDGQAKGREAEFEANAFASAFLMPKTSMLAYAPRRATLRSLVGAKHGWGVSVSALAHRLHRLELLSEWHYISICRQIQTHGYRDSEPEPCAREMSQVWPQVFAGLKADGIGRSELAQRLSWPLKELRALVFQLVLSAEEGGGGHDSEPANPRDRIRLVR
jgi:Zn-dependent peptidase ImmA (M78 family)/transcriptional regulator with XRE-family HTH domain